MSRQRTDKRIAEALSTARDAVFWLEGLPRLEQEGPLAGHVEADLAIVGGRRE